MTKRNNLYFFSFFLSTLFFLISCGQKITITRSYIYSTGWGNGEYQGFRIAKIKLLDSTISVFNDDFNRFDLASYIIDSSFCYGAGRNHGAKEKMPKIYFDRGSDLFIWYKCGNILEYRKTIGLLELDTWYVILGLGGTIDYYVYIDNEGRSHAYSLGPTNW
ncbi:MAG: hypothetical protein M3O67_03270 [Bacteroidota bacterium]|nr:hypothetical protein [Bacteroidota bacterium]